MTEILQKLIEIGNTVGTITEIHMYDSDFITIEGVECEGRKFSLTLHVKEEENNA